MELIDYFEPVFYKENSAAVIAFKDSLASQIDVELKQDIKTYDVAIIGISDATNSPDNLTCALSPNVIRARFSSLRSIGRHVKIIDLGNVKGKSVRDKYFVVKEVVAELIKENVIVLFIGGSQDYFIPIVEGVKYPEKVVSIIDYKLDLGSDQDSYTSESFLTKLDGNFLINLLGVQGYYLGETQSQFLEKEGWYVSRLRDIRGDNISFIEPSLRDTHCLCFDIGAINSPNIKHYNGLNVNGFSALDACQIMWYAGQSDVMKSCYLSEFSAGINAVEGEVLMAQMVWHFIEGVSLRNYCRPEGNSNNCKIFIVHLQDYGLDLRFYKSKGSNKWWVALPNSKKEKIIACSEAHYESAKNGEIAPYLWRYVQGRYGVS